MSEDHWRWKHTQLPSPVQNVWLAFSGGRPIFQTTGIPLRYRLPAGEATGMVSVDTMTDPDFRRLGLLTNVGRLAYQCYRQAGVAFVTGLPNEQWGSRATALGWEPLFLLRWLVRPIRPEAMLARKLRRPGLGRVSPAGALLAGFWGVAVRGDSDVAIREVEEAGPEFDSLWEACAPEYRASIVRDREWVGWRFLGAPHVGYRVLLAERPGRPAGYLAFRVEEGEGRRAGYLAELFGSSRDQGAARSLISRAVEIMREAGVEVVATQAVPGTWPHRTFRRAGFLLSRAEFPVQWRPLDPGLPHEVLRQPSNWFMSGADFDSI